MHLAENDEERKREKAMNQSAGFDGFEVLKDLLTSRAVWVVILECAHQAIRLICNN